MSRDFVAGLTVRRRRAQAVGDDQAPLHQWRTKMTIDQAEATTTPETRRAFLTRVALLGVAAAMTFGVAGGRPDHRE